MKDFVVCLLGHWKQIVPLKAVIFKNLSPVQFILKTSRGQLTVTSGDQSCSSRLGLLT